MVPGIDLGAKSHREEHPGEHRDVLDDQQRPDALDEAGGQEADDSERRDRRPWPMRYIQADIGTVIVTAIRPSIAAGAS